MQRPRAKRKLPSKLYNVHCKTPILDPKLNAVLKENSVSGMTACLVFKDYNDYRLVCVDCSA